jgi:hypothetical protein
MSAGAKMKVQGKYCTIIFKTSSCEMDIPYSDETLREAVSFLQEEASIEGGGVCRGIQKRGGVTGCVVTPLTIRTAPLLLYLAMGAAGKPVFVSETKDLYKHFLDLLPTEDTEHFDLIQDRGGGCLLYEGCRVMGFELRIMREEAIKLKLEICGECSPRTYPYTDSFEHEAGERFTGDRITYMINGQEYTNIYGITILSKKQGGAKTELWIKRALQKDGDIPAVINEMIITAHLLRDKYGNRYFGTFSISLKRLALVSDETEINAADTVIGPLRYYVAGGITSETFSNGE